MVNDRPERSKRGGPVRTRRSRAVAGTRRKAKRAAPERRPLERHLILPQRQRPGRSNYWAATAIPHFGHLPSAVAVCTPAQCEHASIAAPAPVAELAPDFFASHMAHLPSAVACCTPSHLGHASADIILASVPSPLF